MTADQPANLAPRTNGVTNGVLTSEELARRVRSGCRPSFEQLVERHGPALLGYLRQRTGRLEDAEELLQETFLRAWRKLHLYDDRWRFSTWLYTLARRLAATRLRSERPAAANGEQLASLGVRADPGAALSEREQAEHLWSLAREALDEEPCTALWLRYGEGLSNAEIGRVLERPETTVRVILFRARAALAQELEAAARREAAPRPALAARPRLLRPKTTIRQAPGLEPRARVAGEHS